MADTLAARITSGEIPVGAKMPGRRELAGAEQVSPQTVEKALRVLAGWGLVESAQGVGVFVISDQPVIPRTLEQRVADLEAEMAEVRKMLPRRESHAAP